MYITFALIVWISELKFKSWIDSTVQTSHYNFQELNRTFESKLLGLQLELPAMPAPNQLIFKRGEKITFGCILQL